MIGLVPVLRLTRTDQQQKWPAGLCRQHAATKPPGSSPSDASSGVQTAPHSKQLCVVVPSNATAKCEVKRINGPADMQRTHPRNGGQSSVLHCEDKKKDQHYHLSDRGGWKKIPRRQKLLNVEQRRQTARLGTVGFNCRQPLAHAQRFLGCKRSTRSFAMSNYQSTHAARRPPVGLYM